jgi:predicted transport protein
MDPAEKTMIDNLLKNTGKSLEQWIAIVQKKNPGKHGEIIKFLKEEHGFTHGFANLVAHKSKGSDAGSVDDKDSLVEQQYAGKENLKPIYEKLLSEVLKFGKDVELAPKNAYVSLRRKKQFGCLQPATKTRFEIGLNLKGEVSKGILEEVTTPNTMFSHKIKLQSVKELTPEMISWLRKAYDKAG